ncbi:MAG: DUF1549 domain-containing protein [Acidobacteria bacterium]|nr:DUF1549 domain-containing protein [Acidobacteriota bacterium]
MARVLSSVSLGLAMCLSARAQVPAPVQTDDTFPGAHAPLLQKDNKPDPGALTDRVARALPKAAGTAGSVPHRNFIDSHIFGKMRRDAVPHAPLATDAEFCRRAWLDLTGRIPSPEDIRAFLADSSPNKREALINKLTESEAFVEKWSYFFMDFFRANGKMGRGYMLFHYWLKESLRADRPYDDMVRSMIASSAKSNLVVAASNVIVREHVEGKPGQPVDGEDLTKVHQLDTHDEIAILYGKAFLGINLSCISCHDGRSHLEKVNVWLTGRKRRDFFAFASFLGKTRYIPHVENTQAQMGHFIVDDLAPGYDPKGASMLRPPRFGASNEPAFLITGEKPAPGKEPREELGRMLTSHPQFARAAANLFWARLMGRGIVDPYDEFDLARQDPRTVPAGWPVQPSHPELLDQLAADFRSNGYHLRHLFRRICNSSAYQLSARFPGEWKENYSPYFARKFVRMLGAEELHDALATATGRPGSFKYGSSTVGMAMQANLPSSGGELKSFMTAFGQSNRSNPPRPPSPSPLQPLLLMRSPVVNDKVLAEKDSRVQRLLDSYPDNGKVVEELFLATLARFPSAPEKELAAGALAANRKEGAQNVQWALLNLAEFLYNY